MKLQGHRLSTLFAFHMQFVQHTSHSKHCDSAGCHQNALLHLDQCGHDQPEHRLLAAGAVGLQFNRASTENADRHGRAGTPPVSHPCLLARGGCSCPCHGFAAGFHLELMAAAAASLG